ncbi:MAG: KH domain-containing protein [Candidatus Altiarchaeia archaeon]
MQYLKIPEERIAVLIGERGCIKKDLEQRTNTKIAIEETSVNVESSKGNSMEELIAGNIVLAIGRGFNPEIAFKLINDDYTLEILHLHDYGSTPKSLERIKSRVIGEKGRCRKNIEELSGAYLSIYGKTIAIIGSFDDTALAKEAILLLIDGARHASVYRMLEKTRAARRDVPWSGEIPKN